MIYTAGAWIFFHNFYMNFLILFFQKFSHKIKYKNHVHSVKKTIMGGGVRCGWSYEVFSLFSLFSLVWGGGGEVWMVLLCIFTILTTVDFMLSPPPFLVEIGKFFKWHAKSPPPFLAEKSVKSGGGLSMNSTVFLSRKIVLINFLPY